MDLAVIEKKSEFSWKTLVKRKAKEYELERLILLKETKNKSKMKDLEYEKLLAQEYLTNLDVHLAKTVFRFRVRMERFNGNFRGQGPTAPCPLCGLHKDDQHLSFKCLTVTKELDVTEEYENLFKVHISIGMAKTCHEIVKLRTKEK